MGIEVVDAAVVNEEIIGGGDGTAFFEVFDFALVALADLEGAKGAFGALGNAFIAKFFGGDNGNKGELAREFVFKDFVFGPRINAVEDDAFLASGKEIFGFGDGLPDDPIFAFGFADHFAEIAFVIGGDFEAALGHFFDNHAAEIDFGDAARGEIVDDDGFAASTHADDGEDFDISRIFHIRAIIA